MNSFDLTMEYGGLTQQRTHGDVKVIFYGEPLYAPLVMANLGQLTPGTLVRCKFEVVDKETGEIGE